MKQFCILQNLAYILYCVSLIMVTITRHAFIYIFQTKHFLAVKFSMGYEKNVSFLVIAKSPKVWKKKKKKQKKTVEKIGPSSFKYSNSRGVGQDPSYCENKFRISATSSRLI